MIEVTRSNFSYILPQIQSAINDADFVSIDTEFTGLFLNDDCKPSLFDASADRYQKLKKSVESFTLAQIGITAFLGDSKNNRYNATSFSFYLCPPAFGSVDPRFSIQSSSLQFLSIHSFDFNKCFKEGLSYLNCHQEVQIMAELKAGFHHMGDDHFAVERELQRVCSNIASWMCHCKPGEFLTVSIKDTSFSSLYTMQHELRSRFPNVWTSVNDFNQIVVENMTVERKMHLETEVEDWEHTQHQLVLTELLGFTRVFRLLTESKKPLVGHNLLTDLLFIYSKFHRNLPDTYEQFKKEINGLFPAIFDTKHLHHFLKQRFVSLNLKGAYNLEVLDQILNSQTAVRLTRMQPAIQKPLDKKSGDGTIGNAPHHAGYDSFLCGCVFMRICHLVHFTTNAEAESSSPFTFKSYLPSMEKHKNCINVIRASSTFTRLDGEDPSSQRPPLLHVSYKGPERRITSQQLAAEFSVFGTVDIKMITSTEAILTTSHFMISREIMTSFKNHRTIRVTKFRYLLHSTFGKCLFWGTIGAASICYVSFLLKIIKK